MCHKLGHFLCKPKKKKERKKNKENDNKTMRLFHFNILHSFFGICVRNVLVQAMSFMKIGELKTK